MMAIYRIGLADAPMANDAKRVLANGDYTRYEVEWAHTYLDDMREIWWVRKRPGPRGAAGAVYRVVAPRHNRADLPQHWVGRVQCDCPEARNGGSRLGGICKHALMVYCAQGSWYGNPARWLYAEVHVLKFRAGDHTDNTEEATHG
jgi:hypothetical protein